MTVRSQRVRLSFLVLRTQRMLLLFLCGVAFLLGTTYLFVLNRVALNGYILTIQTETRAELLTEVEKLDAQIAFRQTQTYLSKSKIANDMILRVQPRYVVLRQTYTAQK